VDHNAAVFLRDFFRRTPEAFGFVSRPLELGLPRDVEIDRTLEIHRRGNCLFLYRGRLVSQNSDAVDAVLKLRPRDAEQKDLDRLLKEYSVPRALEASLPDVRAPKLHAWTHRGPLCGPLCGLVTSPAGEPLSSIGRGVMGATVSKYIKDIHSALVALHEGLNIIHGDVSRQHHSRPCCEGQKACHAH
jgi:hypothetical protein